MSWLAILVLAAGTYVFRIIGPVFRHRIRVPLRVEQLLSDASVVVLVALVANSTLASDGGFAGWSRVIGVTVGGILASINLPPVRTVVVRRFPRSGRQHRHETRQDASDQDAASQDATGQDATGQPHSSRKPIHIPFPVIIVTAAVVTALLRVWGLE